MRLIRPLLAATLLLAANARAGESLTMKAATDEQATIFLGGAAFALAYSNLMLQADKRPPIYCAPITYAPNAKEMWRLASKALTGPHEPRTFVMAAVDELRKEYPCEQR
jgi:hypothetical protein